MKATIELWLEPSKDILDVIAEPLHVESLSSPPGGDVRVNMSISSTDPLLKMTSEDLSTSRAMLNSYLGLITVAVDAASSQ